MSGTATNPQLPLESAYRLRSASTSHIQRIQEHRQQQSRWNGNGQGATNDSEEYKAAVRIVDGFPVEYSCLDDPRREDDSEDDTQVEELRVQFDYEMISRKSVDVEKSMRSLEWSLLWNVARNLGLHNCNYKKQNPVFDTRRQLAPSTENFIVGLSSLEFDRIDYETKRCTILSKDVNERTICTPMQGIMTAHFTGDSDIIRKYLQQNIEKEMNSRRVRIEEVKECRYIGDRSLLRPTAIKREKLESQNNSTNRALVFGALAGVIMLVFAILLARGRRRREEAEVLDDGETTSEPLPIPIPPIAYEQRSHEELKLALQPSGSGDTEESIPDQIDPAPDLDEERGLQPVSVASIATGRAPMSSDSSERTDDSNIETSGSYENLGNVPHRPPVFVVPIDTSTTKEPIESKTLKTRRKRKKKRKKQRVLKRVSSKQSINEMETINEMDEGAADYEEEGSEFDGSEYSASEYSTDDDDDALLMVNMPTDSGSDVGNSPKDSSGPVIPPSPIREEPKIRRLPPPWI